MPLDIKHNTKVDWPFLLFILGVTYVKFSVKVAAVVLYACYVLYKKYPLKKPSSLQWFYIIILSIGVLSSYFNDAFYDSRYKFGFTFGVMYWCICLLASYLTYITISLYTKAAFMKLLKSFFTINAVISILTLMILFVQAGFHVPYWYDEGGQFGVSTGDYINGVFNDNSVTNAAINALGALFFLYKREFKWAALCAFVMLLCTSNVTVIFLSTILLVILVTKRDLAIQRNSFWLLMMMLVSYPILSPQNLKYIEVVYEREKKDDYNIGLDKLAKRDIAITPEVQQKDFFKKNINSAFKVADYKGVIHSYKYYPYKKDIVKPVFLKKEFYANIGKYKMGLKQEALINISNELMMLKKESDDSRKGNDGEDVQHSVLNPFSVQKAIGNWYKTPADNSELVGYDMPGKVYTNLQTLYFLRSNTTHMLFGAGIGNFSSKLAVKMTGLGLQGSYPEGKVCVSIDFLQYHFYSLMYFLSRHAAEHSVMNLPNSVYNQLGGEYGLLGLLAFLILYVGFIIKKGAKTKLSLYTAALLFMFLGMEYWFELISLTVIFELIFTSEIFAKSEHEQS